ncbi:MAG: glycosyltransferase family 4 protein [Candidatus Odinarchaeota archaeon]
MHVLFTFLYNTSLQILSRAGFITREITIPLKLREKKIEYTFLTYGDKSEFKFSKVLNGINIIPVFDLINFNSKRINFIKSFLIPIKIRKQLQSIDIVRTDQLDGSWIAAIIKLLYRKKLIIRAGYEWLIFHILDHAYSNKRSFLKYWIRFFKIYFIEFFSYKLADRIVLTNPYNVDFIIKTFKLKKKRHKINVIYNFVNINHFRPLSLKKLDKHILFIGRFSKEKNLVNLIKAFKDLEEFSLDIIGKGREGLELINLAKKFGISANFLGVVPHNKLPETLNKYEIFILPSYHEGNPKVLLEAMSCGLACIGTNVWGIRNIIKHNENGILCKTDPDSIKDAILTLYNDKNLMKKLGINARNFILKNCSLEAIIEQELLLYKSFSS